MKTKYKVTGLTAYREHQPGEEFEADLTEEEEERAVERGSIKPVGGKAQPKGGKADA